MARSAKYTVTDRAQWGTLNQAIGKSRGGMTTKILALTDALGNLIDFILMPGQAHDLVKTRELLAGVCCQSLLADKALRCGLASGVIG